MGARDQCSFGRVGESRERRCRRGGGVRAREEGGEMLGEVEGGDESGEMDEDEAFVGREEDPLGSRDQKRVGMLCVVERLLGSIIEFGSSL